MITPQSAEDWYDDVGWYTQESEEPYRQFAHPICEPAMLDAYPDDGALIAALRAKGDTTPEPEAYELIACARDAWSAARTYHEHVLQAIARHEQGDTVGAGLAFDAASRTECEFGDDPATTTVAQSLGYQWDHVWEWIGR